MADQKPINWQNALTIVSVAILVGTEVVGMTWAAGWALGGLFQLPGIVSAIVEIGNRPIRIGLEDSQGVFLHGTSDPHLFERGAHTLSHGCVRVQRIHDVAAWIMDMPVDELRAQIATGRTIELTPPQEVQVALAYLTAWPRPDGRLALHPDPYGIDRPATGCRPTTRT